MKNFFDPKSIAIVGATEKTGKVGNAVAKNILERGYDGEVFLVNPKYQKLFSKKCYSKVSEIEARKIDLVIVVVPAQFVQDVVLDSKSKAKNFIVISAGFAETGLDGGVREKDLEKIAKENNLNILGPNCLGFINPSFNLNASFASGMPEAGNIAFVSQSGALAVAFMDKAKSENISFSKIISVGNKMQISETEMIEYLGSDPKTKVIGMYLEGIKNGRRFMEVAKKVALKKPIVILKAGKTNKAQQAIASHTGALAGSDEIMEVVFDQVGIVRAKNLEEFLSLLGYISKNETPKNEEVAVVTNAGGAGVIITDAFKNKEIILSDLSLVTKENLRKFLPNESSVENPIDLLGDALEDRYALALQELDKTKIGTIVAILTPQDQTPVKKIAEKLVDFKKRSRKNLAAVFVGEERVKQEIDFLKENGINNFSYPELAVDVLNGYFRWNKWRMENKVLAEKSIFDQKRVDKARKIIAHTKDSGRKALLFSEASKLMKLYGINVTKFWSVEQLEAIKYPVVAKVDSDKVLHKTDKQGVVLNIKNNDELKRVLMIMKKNFPNENIIIQPMLERQAELILGIKKDEIFGPIIVFGLGGIYTEVFRLVDFLIPETDLSKIKTILAKSKIKFLFEGVRGQKKYNFFEMVCILEAMSRLALEVDDICELDVNPLLIYNDKNKAVAVDVKIII